jgi:hypothetical protein
VTAFHSKSTSFKRKGVVQVWVLPELARIDHTEYLAIELHLCAVNLGGFRAAERRMLGFIHPHALARMFLRLRTTAFATVREQIRSSFYMYAALAEACRAQQLQQIVIPTRGGHFRCDVRAGVTQPCALIAKTWIASATCGLRDFAVLESIANVLCAWNGRATPEELCSACFVKFHHELAVFQESVELLLGRRAFACPLGSGKRPI